MLSPEQAKELHWAETTAQPETTAQTGARYDRARRSIVSKKWTDGVVPYQISNAFSECDQKNVGGMYM